MGWTTEVLPVLVILAALVDRSPQTLASIWPNTVRDWVYIAVATTGGVVAFWNLSKIWNGVVAQFATMSDQAIEADKEIAKLKTRADTLEREQELMQLNYTNLRESIGRMSVQVQTMAETFNSSALERARQFGEIGAHLERIETKVEERAKRREPGA